ncbi:uncharacterized protein LOC108114028 [Drosophila eugracilis]|uniref:uncharacterized protein LOC108114028 n=1 Tax=Drosophila eugracilis TaxID=29029 RepID=UPI0007E758DE|nr:uncharacterized protein LOC108114028 [Drosophila eugracilis]
MNCEVFQNLEVRTSTLSFLMTRILSSNLLILGLIRFYYDMVGTIALLCLLGFGVLDYGYCIHGCDLLWWRQIVMLEEITPLSTMLHIVCIKAVLILGLALWSYNRTEESKEHLQTHKDMPIAYVRRRYCRFLVMRLLASLDMLIYNQPRLKDFSLRHKDLNDAVELFRWEARRLFERTELQLRLPLHEVFPVEDLQEEKLLQLGYGENLQQLRELDIHMMVYGT